MVEKLNSGCLGLEILGFIMLHSWSIQYFYSPHKSTLNWKLEHVAGLAARI
jgi:hypothetical protein